MLALALSALLVVTPEDVLSTANDAGVFDGELLVARDGKVVTERSWGLANAQTKTPHVTGEVWRWASVTKQLTAVLVMQEIERKHLTLETTIGAVLPTFRGPTKSKVTVRMLLQHTSGLPNPDDTEPGEGGVPAFYRGPADLKTALGFCGGAVKPVTPGTTFAYDNCDYRVLEAMLEAVTHLPWKVLVQQRFGTRLALERLAVDARSPVVGQGEQGTAEPTLSLETFGAAGALGGTLVELFRFDEALRTGKLLGPAALATLWKGEPKLGFEALGQWSYDATLAGCEKPVHLVERRGDLGGVVLVNVIAPERPGEVLVFSNTAKTDWGQVWQGQGLLHDVLAAAFCRP
jgi:CubicO group peptidase (beta-lactamase class C family)